MFDSDSQKMKCPYCDSEFEIEALKSYNDELLGEDEERFCWDNSGTEEWKADELEGIKTYLCKSCGGEIIGDATSAATSCPYCGNPIVFSGQLSGVLRPDLVIPFKIDKEQAKSALKAHFKGKKLLPGSFADENRLDEIKGIYVPFWLFDANTSSRVRYRGERYRHWSDSEYFYTKTYHYALIRGGDLEFEKIPVDGSSKMCDQLMESIEPYDMGKAVDFESAYLAGYFADRYDVSSAESIERANQRIKLSVEDEFRSTTVGFFSVRTENSNIGLLESSVKYALLPIWLFRTSYKDKNYIFAMNGQTGKLVGDLPMDIKAYFKWLFGISAIAGIASFILIILFGLM